MMRLPPIFTGSRGGPGWARAASLMQQPQKAIPVAAAPFRKLLRVGVIEILLQFR
jgi:hypothetical protein